MAMSHWLKFDPREGIRHLTLWQCPDCSGEKRPWRQWMGRLVLKDLTGVLEKSCIKSSLQRGDLMVSVSW